MGNIHSPDRSADGSTHVGAQRGQGSRAHAAHARALLGAVWGTVLMGSPCPPQTASLAQQRQAGCRRLGCPLEAVVGGLGVQGVAGLAIGRHAEEP